MSSDFGTSFGVRYQEAYAKLLKKWEIKLEDVKELSPALQAQWGAELELVLADAINDSLLSDGLEPWDKVNLPTKDTLANFAKIALKYTLVFASVDLLRRYVRSVQMNKAHPPGQEISGEIRFYRPSEIISRAAQTVAQIYDMARDFFSAILNRSLTGKQELTGRKRWVAVGDGSRHAALHHQIRPQDGTFTYRKKEVYGPRPAGGSPYDWSNCSCRLQYERKDGSWVG